MNFENYMKEAYTMLHEVARALGIRDQEKAARIFRAVLHAIRDRIPPEEAVHLGANLPIVWKGIYYNGFSLRHKPAPIRTKTDWEEFIRERSGAPDLDFPAPEYAHAAFQDIMLYLERVLPDGQFRHVMDALHSEIQKLIIEDVPQIGDVAVV